MNLLKLYLISLNYTSITCQRLSPSKTQTASRRLYNEYECYHTVTLNLLINPIYSGAPRHLRVKTIRATSHRRGQYVCIWLTSTASPARQGTGRVGKPRIAFTHRINHV